MVNIAVMGYGTVGSGVVEVINTNGDIINQRAGDEINIKYVLDISLSFNLLLYQRCLSHAQQCTGTRLLLQPSRSQRSPMLPLWLPRLARE